MTRRPQAVGAGQGGERMGTMRAASIGHPQMQCVGEPGDGVLHHALSGSEIAKPWTSAVRAMKSFNSHDARSVILCCGYNWNAIMI